MKIIQHAAWAFTIMSILFSMLISQPVNAQRNTDGLRTYYTHEHGFISRHSQLKSYTAKHKTIAILPVEVNIADKKINKNKNSDPELLKKKEEKFRTDFQRSFYERLAIMQKKKKLKVEVQDIAITNKLLAENNIENADDLLSYKYSEIAEMLGVDAVFAGSADITQYMSKGGAMVLNSMINNSGMSADESIIIMQLHDGNDGKLIWRMSQNSNNSSMVWKTEKLIQSMFKEGMSKTFPYHIRFK